MDWPAWSRAEPDGQPRGRSLAAPPSAPWRSRGDRSGPAPSCAPGSGPSRPGPITASVRALLHDDPTGAAGQQPRRLAVVPEALDRLSSNHNLDADVPQPLDQVDGRVDPRGESTELVEHEDGVFALAGFAAGGVVAVVLQHHPHGRIRLRLGQQCRHGEDDEVDVLIAPVAAVEGAGQGGEEVGVAQPGSGEVLADGLDVSELERTAFPQGREFVDVQAPQQLVGAVDGWHAAPPVGRAFAGR